MQGLRAGIVPRLFHAGPARRVVGGRQWTVGSRQWGRPAAAGELQSCGFQLARAESVKTSRDLSGGRVSATGRIAGAVERGLFFRLNRAQKFLNQALEK